MNVAINELHAAEPNRAQLLVIDGSITYERSVVGGKAYFLNVLHRLGLRVPPTVALPIGADTRAVDEILTWARHRLADESGWELAVRSSAAAEDSHTQSNAGHFLSVLGWQDARTLGTTVAQVLASGPDMAVVVQPLLRPVLAGVAFSMNPLTHMRCELSVSWTDGLADRLVSGDVPGKQLMYRNGQVEGDAWPADPSLLDELRVATHLIEGELDGPVDIEWAIDADSQVWIVQARPAVLFESAVVTLRSPTDVDRLPALVSGHPKLRLRQLAIREGVPMAPAEVEILSRGTVPLTGAPSFDGACGTSVVLLHPERINAAVVREFAPAEPYDAGRFERTCRRYKVRRYPKNTDALEAIQAVLGIGTSSCWTSIAIVQAIWDAQFTGIVRRSVDGYVVDIAQGHFVPKGVVPTSTIVLSPTLKILSATWREQPTVYRFCEGHVVTDDAPSLCEVSETDLAAMVTSFGPLFEAYGDAALEFGMVRRGESLQGYLIDVAEGDARGLDLGITQIQSGVLSAGRCVGRLLRLDPEERQALDAHFHDRSAKAEASEDDVIIVAPRASVDLLPYVSAPGVVGFIFEHGAVLAHLAVVLREKGIPAIALSNAGDFAALPAEGRAALDATSAVDRPAGRVRLI